MSETGVANYLIVAPFTGAWIEIYDWSPVVRQNYGSLPSRERGLKLTGNPKTSGSAMSLPSRERGLKLICSLLRLVVLLVAPFTGAWIEIEQHHRADPRKSSLPSRERGLKYYARLAASGL